jgi:HSP20 family protein
MSAIKWNDKGVIPTVNSFFSDMFHRDDDFMSRFTRKTELPVVNIFETDDTFTLEVAAPGMKRDDFKIELEDNALLVSSEFEEEMEDEGKNYTTKEYVFKSFKRSFWLPENVDIENIKANFKNGVLDVKIPKKEIVQKETRTIDIR